MPGWEVDKTWKYLCITESRKVRKITEMPVVLCTKHRTFGFFWQTADWLLKLAQCHNLITTERSVNSVKYLGQNFFISWFTNPPTVILRKVGKKKILISKIFILFYPPTLNIICFVEKNNIFLRFCLCIFESDTVESDCPAQIFRKMIKYLKI